MAFDFGQYPQDPATGGVAGRSYVDPEQLQIQPQGISLQNPAPTSPMLPGNTGINGGNLGGQVSPTVGGANLGGAGGPMTPPPPSPFTNVGSGQQWDQNYFTQNFGTPRTPQELVALEQKITAAGGKVLRNASGVAGKIQTPDGRIIDVINSAGAGGNGFQWLDGGGGGGVNGSAGGTLGSLGYSFGSSMAPFTGQFAAPTEQEAINTPGVQFGLNEANRMMQNSAAAKGTLLNGRFQQGLAASNIGNAMQDYGNIYNRALTTFGTNYGIFKDNQDRPFDKNVTLAKLGQPQ